MPKVVSVGGRTWPGTVTTLVPAGMRVKCYKTTMGTIVDKLRQKKEAVNFRADPKLISLIVSTFFCSITPSSALDDNHMLVFSATGDMMGPGKAYISNIGVRMQNRLGFTLWIRSKPDQTLMGNLESKTYTSMPTSKYIKDMHSDYPLKLEKTKTVRTKISASQVNVDLYNADLSTSNNSNNNVKNSATKLGHIVINTNLNLPPDLVKFWNALAYALPDPGFAMSASYLTPDYTFKHRFLGSAAKYIQKKGESFKTIMAVDTPQTVPLDRTLFEIPAKFRYANDPTSMFLSGDGELKPSDIDDLFRERLK